MQFLPEGVQAFKFKATCGQAGIILGRTGDANATTVLTGVPASYEILAWRVVATADNGAVLQYKNGPEAFVAPDVGIAGNYGELSPDLADNPDFFEVSSRMQTLRARANADVTIGLSGLVYARPRGRVA